MLKNYSKIEISKYGDKFYLNDEGKRHRLDGPAIEFSSGSKCWYINGKHHRNIGPFAEYSNGVKYWWLKGQPHRVGSSFSSDDIRWYIDGKQYAKQEYFNKVWDI